MCLESIPTSSGILKAEATVQSRSEGIGYDVASFHHFEKLIQDLIS